MAALAPRDFDLVSRATVFAGLTLETVACMTAAASLVPLAKHDLLYRQDDPATALFVVVDGEVKLCRAATSGEKTVIDVLGRGECMAVAAAFAGTCYSATAEAVGEARAVKIPVEQMIRCVREVPEFAFAVVTSNSQHSDRLLRQIEQLKTQRGLQRLAKFLASLCPIDAGPCVVALPYDKGLIAGHLGIMPETLSRMFAKLKSAGVGVRASRVAVSDVGRLRQLADEDQCTPAEIPKAVTRAISCPKLASCRALGRQPSRMADQRSAVAHTHC